jgi:hypothetical protein
MLVDCEEAFGNLRSCVHGAERIAVPQGMEKNQWEKGIIILDENAKMYHEYIEVRGFERSIFVLILTRDNSLIRYNPINMKGVRPELSYDDMVQQLPYWKQLKYFFSNSFLQVRAFPGTSISFPGTSLSISFLGRYEHFRLIMNISFPGTSISDSL